MKYYILRKDKEKEPFKKKCVHSSENHDNVLYISFSHKYYYFLLIKESIQHIFIPKQLGDALYVIGDELNSSEQNELIKEFILAGCVRD